MTTAAPSLPDNQHLCTNCGMCCDGTLFEYVEIEPDERAQVSSLFDLTDGEKGPVFLQPCPHTVARVCTAYDNRPATCRAYRCKTLIALETGDITRPEALRRVEEALHARETVRPFMTEGETMFRARQRRAAIASEPERVPGALQFVLKLTALDLMLDRYFRKQGKTMLR